MNITTNNPIHNFFFMSHISFQFFPQKGPVHLCEAFLEEKTIFPYIIYYARVPLSQTDDLLSAHLPPFLHRNKLFGPFNSLVGIFASKIRPDLQRKIVRYRRSADHHFHFSI